VENFFSTLRIIRHSKKVFPVFEKGIKKDFAQSRNRTGVAAATTRSTNHYTIWAMRWRAENEVDVVEKEEGNVEDE
jgi:hypothetical protein